MTTTVAEIAELHPLASMFALMIAAHFLFDFPLQGQYLSDAKNHKAPIPGVPWQWALFGHSVMHGAAVWWITGYWFIGVAEICIHAIVDHQRCAKNISFMSDQLLHVISKIAWTALAFGLMAVS